MFDSLWAQVSRAWRVLAEDGVLWFRMCMKEGFLQGAGVSDSPCWKSTLRDCRNSARTVSSNWKVGSEPNTDSAPHSDGLMS